MINLLKYLFIGILFIPFKLLSQDSLKGKIIVEYQLIAKKTLKENFPLENEFFLLIANEKASIFLAKKAYQLDSIKALGEGIDRQLPYFRLNGQQSIYVNNRIIDFSDLVMDHEFGYREKNEMNWKLEDETKIVGGLKCRKATISKYGRDWIAYFSDDYLFPFGPYKFNGLPGLILELYDINNDYHYSAIKIEKYDKKYPIFRFLRTKYISKDEMKKVRKNLEADNTLGGKIKLDETTKKKLRDYYEDQLKYANPIELD